MPIRADNDPRYSRRFLIMGIVAIGFALWSLYDGTIVYPAKRTTGFDDFKADYKDDFADPRKKALSVDQFEVIAPIGTELRAKWGDYSHSRNIPSGPDIFMQFVMVAVAGVAGIFLISIPIRARGRWIEGDESGITSSWGQSFQYDQLEQVNKRKWRDKGIAKVTYIDNGRRKLFVIDDFKFMREPTDKILYELEQRIEVERITDGPPEDPPDAHAEEPAHAVAPTTADEPS